MRSTDSTRKQTAMTWAAIAAVLLILGLAGGQDRAGEELEAQVRTTAIHEAGR